MSKINVRSFSNENDDGAPDIVGISTFSATSYFVPTRGTTAQRPSDHVEVGSLRYNYDIKNLEYYRGETRGWSSFELIDPQPLGGDMVSPSLGDESNFGLGARGLFVGGYGPSAVADIEYITISTLGDSADFGDLNNGYTAGVTTNDRTRGFYSGGNTGNQLDMRIATLASLGDTVDGGGDLHVATKGHPTGCSSSTRGVIMGGRDHPGNSSVNVIQSHTIQTTGNAQNFGDLLAPRSFNGGNCNSSTRGLTIGGYSPDTSTRVNSIEYITMASMGNTVDFGDVSYVHNSSGSASNSTRGIIAGGRTPGDANNIEYVTIATLGDTTDFGDLNTVVNGDVGCCTSPTRCVIGGGGAPQGAEMLYVEIASTGNAVQFGELTVAKLSHSNESLQEPGIWSTGHGGL